MHKRRRYISGTLNFSNAGPALGIISMITPNSALRSALVLTCASLFTLAGCSRSDSGPAAASPASAPSSAVKVTPMTSKAGQLKTFYAYGQRKAALERCSATAEEMATFDRVLTLAAGQLNRVKSEPVTDDELRVAFGEGYQAAVASRQGPGSEDECKPLRSSLAFQGMMVQRMADRAAAAAGQGSSTAASAVTVPLGAER